MAYDVIIVYAHRVPTRHAMASILRMMGHCKLPNGLAHVHVHLLSVLQLSADLLISSIGLYIYWTYIYI